MKTSRTVVAAAVLAIAALGTNHAAWADSYATAKLAPYPTSVSLQTGNLTLGTSSRIVVSAPSLGDAGGVLSNEIYSVTGKRLPVYQGAARDGDIVLRLDTSLSGESYTCNVGNQAVVSANNYKNLALASTTIVQSLTNSSGTWSLPKMQIADAPASSFRSTMIDLARNPHSIDSIKQQISLNRLYKIPYMQLHLTDDQAFTFATNAISGINGHGSNSTTYSQQDLRSLVKWADQRGVTLIPELDVPSHSTQLVANRPDLFNTGTSSLANIANPAAVTALKNVVGEMASVFTTSPYIHIGGDEADYSQLTYHGTATLPAGVRQQWDSKMDSLGDHTPDAVFRDFANQMNTYIKSLGKKTIMWESPSILNTSVPVDKDVVIMAFENTFTSTPSNYIKAGYKLINASWSPLYIVGFNGSNTGRAASLSEIYNWDKTWFDVYYGNRTSTSAKQVTADTDSILGGQMCLWENTESGELGADRQRVAAMAERLWSPTSGLSYADFLARLNATDAMLASVIVGDTMALPTVVPEPASLTLIGMGLGSMILLAAVRRSRFFRSQSDSTGCQATSGEI
jgi:hexosaminidase